MVLTSNQLRLGITSVTLRPPACTSGTCADVTPFKVRGDLLALAALA